MEEKFSKVDTNNHLKSALVTTNDIEGVKEYKGMKITFVPTALYAYLVGYYTIHQKLINGK